MDEQKALPLGPLGLSRRTAREARYDAEHLGHSAAHEAMITHLLPPFRRKSRCATVR